MNKYQTKKIITEIDDAKKKLESWFATEVDDSWKFLPVIYCESIENITDFCSGSSGCTRDYRKDNHIIEGIYNLDKVWLFV